MKKLILGISSGVFYAILSMLVGLLSTPYILKYISKEEFGVYFLINNIIIWSGILNFGLRGSFKLQLSKAIGAGEETDKLISTSVISQCLIAFVILAAGGIFIIAIPYLLPNLFNSIGIEMQLTAVLLCISFALSLISNPFVTLFSVHNRDSITYSFRSLLLIIQTFFSIILLSFGFGIKGIAITSALAEFIFLVSSYLLFKSTLSHLKININYFDYKVLNQSIKYGKWFLAGFIAQLFIRHTDLFLIEKFSGLESITQFIITSKLYLITTSILIIILKIVSPQLTKHIQSNSSSGDLIIIFIKSIIGLILSSGILIYFSNEYFVNWWVGNSLYLGNSIDFTLLIIFYLGSFNYVIRAILTAHINFKSQKISALTEGILHITLAGILGYFYQLHGIVIGILVSTIISCIINFNILTAEVSFSKSNKRELSIIAFYIISLSTILLLFPSSNPLIDISFIGIFLGSYYLISQEEFNWFIKSLRTR